MARNYPLMRIRYWYTYDVDEICGLYKSSKLHPRTVQDWIKQGLKTIDGAKPFLMYGHDLKNFLGERNIKNKRKMQLHELFCMACRDVKTAYKRRVHIAKQGHLTTMKAVCPDCKNTINKGISLEHYQQVKKIYTAVDVSQLYDCGDSPVKTHLNAHNEMQAKEPTQTELFEYETN